MGWCKASYDFCMARGDMLTKAALLNSVKDRTNPQEYKLAEEAGYITAIRVGSHHILIKGLTSLCFKHGGCA